MAETGDSDLASAIDKLNLLKVTVNGHGDDDGNESPAKTVFKFKHPCGNCGKETTTNCGNCRKEFYCSIDCQKAQRRKHRLICFPAKEEIGVGVSGCGDEPRIFWVATRNIEQGERIFTDCPLMIWPGVEDLNPGEQVCLGCHKILKNFDVESDPRKCGVCKWPVCGETCSESELHLKECPTLCATPFEKTVRKPDMPDFGIYLAYNTVGLIRLQGLRRFDPIKWEQLLNLYIPETEFKEVLGTVSRKHNLSKSDDRYEISRQCEQKSDEAKITLSRILAARDYHKRSPYFSKEDKSEQVIYDKETRMDISCVENCFVSKIRATENKKDDDGHGIAIVAAKQIQRGQRLTIAFDIFPRWDGTKRRRFLQKTALRNIGVLCKCARCVDPTEFGTNVSAVKCNQCIPGHLFPLNPLDDNSNWKCDSSPCSVVIPGSVVDKIVAKIQKEADTVLRKHSRASRFGQDFSLMDAVHNFVEKYEKILNPQHYILLNLQELSMFSKTDDVHRVISQGKHTWPIQTLKIDRLRLMAEMHLDLANKLFPQYDIHKYHAHTLSGMSKFFSAQQSVRDGGSIDEVMNWLKEGVSHKRKVEIEFKKWLPFSIEFYRRNEMLMEEIYNITLQMCISSPVYSVIPNKMIEFIQTLRNE